MIDLRKNMVGLIQQVVIPYWANIIADHLIENGVIVARLAIGSLQKMHFSQELLDDVEGKEGAAADSAAAAKVSEQNALNSANMAAAAETAARNCQEQACSCATQAGLSRDAAKASESNAKSSEQAAKNAQQAAEQAAEDAKKIAGGDFVTNTEFNQFKETVPTLDDGKVSVQQGGLYINSETTEEDKAEAQEALKEIGLATAIQSLIDSGVISMSAVKSVQRGIITIAADKTEGTATITAVDTAKAVVLFGGSIYGDYNGSNYSRNWDARLVLSSATKVTATRAYASDYNATVPYQVLEFV